MQSDQQKLSERSSGNATYSSLTLDWDSKSKRDKLCEVLQQADSHVEDVCNDKRSAPKSTEDKRMCSERQEELKYLKEVCLGSNVKADDEKFCGYFVEYSSKRKQYCNVDVKKIIFDQLVAWIH